MLAQQILQKLPEERVRWRMDMSFLLEKQELLDTVESTEIVPESGAPTIESAQIDENGTSVIIVLDGGEVNNYELAVTVTTTGGQRRVARGRFVITEEED